MDPRLTDLDPYISLAEKAGRAILQVYGQGPGAASVEWKDDRSPLTRADRASHEAIMQGLRTLTPQIHVISEEGPSDPHPHQDPDGLRWLVDPLDGTKEFLKGSGEFTVNIALVRGGRPLAGIVHAPALKEKPSWTGAEDGAEMRTRNGDRSVLRARQANPAALGVVASRDHAGPRVRALLDALPGAETLSMGSSLKFCLIAEGRADLYLRDGPTMEWDTAAAQAVLEAAGGGVFTLDGRPLGYGKTDLRNPHFVAVGDPALDWPALIENATGVA